MKMRTHVALISAVLIIGGAFLLRPENFRRTSQSIEPPKWREFTSQDATYTLLLPGEPTPLKESELPALKIMGSQLAGIWVERRDFPATFCVYYGQVPVEQSDPDDFLDNVCSVARFMKKGKLEAKKISLQGYPGRQTLMDYKDGSDHQVEISRIYLVNNQFYQIAVVTPTSRASADYVNKFLDSFRLAKQNQASSSR